jgi:hypothetical protein
MNNPISPQLHKRQWILFAHPPYPTEHDQICVFIISRHLLLFHLLAISATLKMRPLSPLPLLVVSFLPLAQCTQHIGADAPSGATLQSLTWGGSGCPNGSNTTWTTDVEGVLSFATPQLKAITGPDSTRMDARKFCQFNLDVRYPAGWQYATKRVAISGYADLMAGISGSTRGDTYFSGQEKEVGPSFPQILRSTGVPDSAIANEVYKELVRYESGRRNA